MATTSSGLTGAVHLGPQCPVETLGEPCKDELAAGVTVTVSRLLPGEKYAAGAVIAETRTDSTGSFQVVVQPGDYVVTADAGMSCELINARVTTGTSTQVDVPCDSGIR